MGPVSCAPSSVASLPHLFRATVRCGVEFVILRYDAAGAQAEAQQVGPVRPVCCTWAICIQGA